MPNNVDGTMPNNSESDTLAIADRQNGVEREYWSCADAEAAALLSALENHERPQTAAVGS